jgi:protein-tyrosine phosphatase
VVRRRVLFRSNALVGLADAERMTLAQLGLRTVVDLREARERDVEPVELGSEIAVKPMALMELAPGTDVPWTLREYYEWLVTTRAERLATTVGALARSTMPAVFFCSTGKDRTGVLNALILSALGVSDAEVARDYQRSEKLIPAEYHQKALERSLAAGMRGDMPSSGLSSPASVMLELLDGLRSRFGGATEYLLAHGLPVADLQRLHAVLVAREPAGSDASA